MSFSVLVVSPLVNFTLNCCLFSDEKVVLENVFCVRNTTATKFIILFASCSMCPYCYCKSVQILLSSHSQATDEALWDESMWLQAKLAPELLDSIMQFQEPELFKTLILIAS